MSKRDSDKPGIGSHEAATSSIDRRAFLQMAGALGVALPSLGVADGLFARASAQGAGAQAASRAGAPILDLAEWTQGYVGIDTVALPRGEFLTGTYLSVECWTPKEIRSPYPVILVHGGNGQGLDWMTTPDGRRGWALEFVARGYKVYVVDRPGQGRPPFFTEVHGAYPAQAPSYEQAMTAIRPQGAQAAHTQWPGSVQIGDPTIDQFMASQGPALPNAAGAESAWRMSGAKLLDQTGPAILVTHGDSSRFALVVADERPALVKGIVAIEAQAPFSAGGRGGGPNAAGPRRLTATPVDFAKIGQIPISILTAEASPATMRDPETVAFLQRAGCRAEQIVLADAGVRGNGPFVMLEKNSTEALQPMLAWLDRRVNAGAPAAAQPPARPNGDSTALRLADQGYTFVGVRRKSAAYGTLAVGQSGVQSFTPAEVRHPFPIVLVHGGGGQATHMMGIGRRPGWLHYFVREGYRVYVMDRPGYGRVPLHPDTFGEDYIPGGGGTGLANILRNSRLAPGTPPGTGLLGEEVGLQFVATEAGNPRRMAEHTEHWAAGAVELLDRIGPSIMLTHAYGGCLGFVAADRRPDLVKALVTVEGNNNPFEPQTVWGLTAVPVAYDPPATDPSAIALADWTPPADSPGPVRPYKIQAEPARMLTNMRRVPMLWMQGENNYSGPAQVKYLTQGGCSAEFIRLRDRGIAEGNTNLMLLERNNFEVFGILRDWLAEHIRA
jgi:pimeloyl-ACP methyl ester carboxylesterase